MQTLDQAPSRRQAILAAAEEVFETHGYAAATIDAVAENAGVAKGSVYNYFRSKRELFAAVFDQVVARLDAEIEQLATAPGTPAEKLRSVLTHWAEGLEHYKRTGRLMLEFWATAARPQQQGELADAFRRTYRRHGEILGRVLEDGLEAGAWRPKYSTAVAAALIAALLDGILIQVILEMGLEVNDELLEALQHAVTVGLQAGMDAQGAEEGDNAHET